MPMRGAVLLLLAGSVLWGCRPEAEAPAVQASSCSASDAEVQAWIETPSVPAEPGGPDDACFFDFAWQQLFVVTQLEKGVPLFSTWPIPIDGRQGRV